MSYYDTKSDEVYDPSRINDGVIYANKTATFVLEPRLVRADPKSKNAPASPLQIFNQKLSVFRFCILQYAPKKESVIANIKVSEAAGFIDEYYLVRQEELTRGSVLKAADSVMSILAELKKHLLGTEQDKKEPERPETGSEDIPADFFDRPAYKECFKMGQLKGKSPADVMLEAPSLREGWEKLKGQREFLAKNAEKYPANKVLLDAIADAQDLANHGKLIPRRETSGPSPDKAPAPAEGAENGPNRLIYEGAMKPLENRAKNNGKSFCYQLKVFYDFGMNAPVRFVIMNGYTDLSIRENGSFRTGGVENAVSKTFRLTNAQMSNLLSIMRYNMEMVAMYNPRWALDTVEKIRYDNKKAADEAAAKAAKQEQEG